MEDSMRKAGLLLALLVASGSAQAGSRQDAKVLLSDNPQALKIEQDWGFADAVVIGDTIYLSGVVAGLRPGETDLQLAYDRAFQRIGKILERAGATWDDVVDITSFHTDLKTQMSAIVAAKNKYIHAPPPAWTAIQVVRLIPDAGITEIKVIAKLPAGRR
jgi:enamine deaminase RidA (YjgF/YER057c/UK114 family)